MSHPRVIRQRIWESLKAVARPDTRFHLRFSEFIPDFEGVEEATDRLMQLEAFRNARLVFVTPDNSMTELRRRLILADRPFVMSTYNMQRGFLYVAPNAEKRPRRADTRCLRSFPAHPASGLNRSHRCFVCDILGQSAACCVAPRTDACFTRHAILSR